MRKAIAMTETRGIFEFRGWIDIHETTDGEDTAEGIKQIIAQIERRLDGMRELNQFFELRNMNGQFSLWMGGNKES